MHKYIILCLFFQYLQHGEQVVKACIENGTHHIDTSGEPLVRYSLKRPLKNRQKGVGKAQESIQSNTITDPGHHMGK